MSRGSLSQFSLSGMRSASVAIRKLNIGYEPWKSRSRNFFSTKPSSSSQVTATKSEPKLTVGSADTVTSTINSETTFWQRFIGPKPMPERNTASWYREMLLICTVFAITGSSTMLIVRPAVSDGLGIKGSLLNGPLSYQICSIVIMTPIYATLLVGIGTIFGRHAYFRHFSVKIFSRFGIPPELIDPSYHATKHTFRKW